MATSDGCEKSASSARSAGAGVRWRAGRPRPSRTRGSGRRGPARPVDAAGAGTGSSRRPRSAHRRRVPRPTSSAPAGGCRHGQLDAVSVVRLRPRQRALGVLDAGQGGAGHQHVVGRWGQRAHVPPRRLRSLAQAPPDVIDDHRSAASRRLRGRRTGPRHGCRRSKRSAPSGQRCRQPFVGDRVVVLGVSVSRPSRIPWICESHGARRCCRGADSVLSVASARVRRVAPDATWCRSATRRSPAGDR